MENKIKHYRVKSSLSQGKLAEYSNVSRQTINAIENNKKFTVAFDIEKVLGVTMENLFISTKNGGKEWVVKKL